MKEANTYLPYPPYKKTPVASHGDLFITVTKALQLGVLHFLKTMSAALILVIATSLSVLLRLWSRQLHDEITFSPAIYLIGAAFNVVLLRGTFDPFPTMSTLDKMMVLITGSFPLGAFVVAVVEWTIAKIRG